MSRTPIHRGQARTLTRAAQAGVLAGGVLLGAVLVFGVPGEGGVPVVEPVRIEVEAEPDAPVGGEDRPARRVSMDGVAERLSMLPNAPRPAPPEPEKPREPAEPEQPRRSADAPQFLGTIQTGSRSVVLLIVDGRQRAVPVGEARGGVEVVEVGDGWVEVRRNGRSQRLERTTGATARGNGSASRVTRVPDGRHAEASRATERSTGSGERERRRGQRAANVDPAERERRRLEAMERMTERMRQRMEADGEEGGR